MKIPSLLAALILATLCACQTPSASEKAPQMKTLQPHVDVPFTRGPALDDATLPTWLAAQTGVVRLPVTMQVDELAQRSDVALGALSIELDDSRLGISLADRLRTACTLPGRCHVWLEGTWRAEASTLDLTRFVRAVADGEAADFVEVEAAP